MFNHTNLLFSNLGQFIIKRKVKNYNILERTLISCNFYVHLYLMTRTRLDTKVMTISCETLVFSSYFWPYSKCVLLCCNHLVLKWACDLSYPNLKVIPKLWLAKRLNYFKYLTLPIWHLLVVCFHAQVITDLFVFL